MAKNYNNPIITCDNETKRTYDPYVIFYEGMYYHCYGDDTRIYVSEATTLWNIGEADKNVVYNSHGTDMSAWYAPELHRINNSWYIYVAPDYGIGVHSMCVLERKSSSPIGDYEYRGKMRGIGNGWSIDGTVAEYDNKMYFIWSGGKEIFLAEMIDPCSVKEPIVLISCPEYDFEKKDGLINEGPAVLKSESGLYVAYSANDSKTDDYCLGLLVFSGGDILCVDNWRKEKHAVFEKTDAVFGPGHCSFTTVEDNGVMTDYIVYHANLGSGTGWNGRNVFAQPFIRKADGYPIFGKPII